MMWELYYGNARKPLARVVPDAKYPGMWRIAWPDGRQSDMVNLTRAKDAAIVLGMRHAPSHESKLLRWKQDRGESGAAGSPMR